MIVLPSLLEYSENQLLAKLKLVKTNYEKTKNYCNWKEGKIYLHLDCVLPDFAKEASVMSSLGIGKTLELIDNFFSGEKLELSIHLMGIGSRDLVKSYQELADYSFKNSWSYSIYLPPNNYRGFLNLVAKNVTIGVWYQPNEWPEALSKTNYTTIAENLLVKKFLLMTVTAGKSGQKADTSLKKEVILSIKNCLRRNPEVNFIVDGGWKLEEASQLKAIPNLEIVSYGDFWWRLEG